jgi:hypothetical protein
MTTLTPKHFSVPQSTALWPDQPFDTVTEARLWVQKFIEWYNEDHRHSALKYVTPNERHEGKATALLQAREVLYEDARKLIRAAGAIERATGSWQMRCI